MRHWTDFTFKSPGAVVECLGGSRHIQRRSSFRDHFNRLKMGKGGKGEKKDTPASSEKVEVVIDGRKYDVTNMKHPGGSVIKFYTNNGIDATQAFNNFHLRSKKARKYLDNLSSVPVETKAISSLSLPGQDALIKDFEEFTAQLQKEVQYIECPSFLLSVVAVRECLNPVFHTRSTEFRRS